MLLALPPFLLVELAAGGGDAVLRGDMAGVGPSGLFRRRRLAAAEPAPGARDLQPGQEALQIALLLG